jgi:hypothetical protein
MAKVRKYLRDSRLLAISEEEERQIEETIGGQLEDQISNMAEEKRRMVDRERESEVDARKRR